MTGRSVLEQDGCEQLSLSLLLGAAAIATQDPADCVCGEVWQQLVNGVAGLVVEDHVREFVQADQKLVELRSLLWKEDEIAIRLLDPQPNLTWTCVGDQFDGSAANAREAFHELAKVK